MLIYDDDHYYLGGVLAEKLRRDGWAVTLATPAPDVSHWTHNTLEQNNIQRRLLELDVALRPHRTLAAIHDGEAELACVHRAPRALPAASVVLVTARRRRTRSIGPWSRGPRRWPRRASSRSADRRLPSARHDRRGGLSRGHLAQED